jgi:hypothetical protein
VQGNQLESLPSSIGGLAALKKLVLNGNRLQRLPAGMTGLSSLRELWLQVCMCVSRRVLVLEFFQLTYTPHDFMRDTQETQHALSCNISNVLPHKPCPAKTCPVLSLTKRTQRSLQIAP